MWPLVIPTVAVHDLGVFFDADLSIKTRHEDSVRLLCRAAPAQKYGGPLL